MPTTELSVPLRAAVDDSPLAGSLAAAPVEPPRHQVEPPERIVVGRVEYASRIGDQLLIVGRHGEQTDLSAGRRATGAVRHDVRHLALPPAASEPTTPPSPAASPRSKPP